MPTLAIAPSPIARLLLELEARTASGGVDVGGRRVVMTKGAIVEVRPASDDASLGDFLVAAGRLSETELKQAKQQATERRSSLENVLRQRDIVPIDVLLDTRRALWLERFVRGIASEERDGKQPGLLVPEPHPSAGPAIITLPFVLDALTRRAGFNEAEQIGSNAGTWFDWLDTAQRERALNWADFGALPDAVQVSALFVRHPAAPSRIAALVRAGLARLSEKRPSLPAPAPRNPVIAAPAPLATRSAKGSIAPPPLAPPAAALPLAPGQARVEQRPIGIDPVLSWFPAAHGRLDDPLDAIERRIASLEQSGAAPSERSRAWLDLARGWRAHHDSIDEAARASREAAAADPTNPDALEASAVLCSASGRPDLAYAYAFAWAETLSESTLHARALVKAAEYGVRAAKGPSALRALRLAAEAEPDDPAIAERLARLHAARGDSASAASFARTAAESYRTVRPEAARAVLSWASALTPDDAEVASDYASSLARDGYNEASVSAIARAARRATDAATARRLWLNAAVRAEIAARPDLASDLLLEGLDFEREDPSLYIEPLLNDLAASGSVVEVAIIAMEIAQRAQGPARAECLVRAGDARLELPGDPSQALELYTAALVADPSNTRAAEMVTQLAEAERAPRYLTDALERALREERSSRAATLALIPRFLVEVTERAPAPLLERWVWSLLARLGGRGPSPEEQQGLEARLAQFETDIRVLEKELRAVPYEQRTEVAIRLADRLRDDPTRRPKARKLYEKIVEIDPSHHEARARLEALLRLEGDQSALCALATQRVVEATGGFARISAELAWVHAEQAAKNPQGAVEACLTLLAHAPKNREAVVLLWRLARVTGNLALARDALARRVDASLDPRERARALVALSQACLEAGDRVEAVMRAETALATDPRCAEAAFLLLEHHADLDPSRRAGVLRAVRAVLGDTPELLLLLARACFATRDAKGQLEALETHLRLSPFDPFPALGLVALRTTGADPDAISAAIRTALSPERFGDGSINAALLALERLWALGHRREAVELVLGASDLLAEAADDLLDWALPAVRDLEDPQLETAMRERLLVRAAGEARISELRKLAYFHREHSNRQAEARTYLRLLAIHPADPEALERLAYIYAETREVERLMSVLTLRLELAANTDERRERLLSLALASIELADDPSGAEDLVRAALEVDNQGDTKIDPPVEALRRGLGLLLGSKSPQTAFDLLLELSEDASPVRTTQLLEEAVCVAERYLQNPDLALRAATLGLESHPEHIAFLLHFERLALDLGDVATGREVYRHLSESSMGVHGRRAVLYRAARWLERAGAEQDALAMVEQAFMLAPSEGAVLQTLERLARAVGQFGGFVRALGVLADEAAYPRQKSLLLLRAASLCEDELRDPERALALYEQAYRALPSADIEQRALSCARRLSDMDRGAARLAYDSWRDMLKDQAAEAWSTVTRVRALVALARLDLDVYGSEADASRHLDEAESALAGDEDLGSEDRSELDRLLADVSPRGRTRHARAPLALAEAEPQRDLPGAPQAQPEPEPAPEPATARQEPTEQELRPPVQLRARPAAPSVTSDPPYDPRARHSQPGGRIQQRAEASPVHKARTYTDPGMAPPVAAASVPLSGMVSIDPRVTQRGLAPARLPFQNDLAVARASALPSNGHAAVAELDIGPLEHASDERGPYLITSEEDQLISALVAGDASVLARLDELTLNAPERAYGLGELLLDSITRESANLGSLRALWLFGTRGGRRASAQVASEVLSYADASVLPVRANRELDPDTEVVRTALLEARDDAELSPTFTMLAHVSQGAGPLFRRGLSAYGVSASDFIAPGDDSPYSRALHQVSVLFGVDHEAYFKHSGEDRLAIVPTQPPAILVGDRTELDALALRFRFARMFEYARPGSALLSTLAPESATTLLSAVKAAFGPTDGKSPPVVREAAAMAAELWRTMPSGTQRQVSNLFRVLLEQPSYPALMLRLSLRAARVGLTASNALDVALANLGVDGDSRDNRVARTEVDLERALRHNVVVRGLVAYALSESYLSLRETLEG